MLDGKLAYDAVNLITDEHINEMEFLAKAMDSAIDQGLREKYYELQVEFHDTYINLNENKEMISLINKLKNIFLRKYYVFEDPDNEIQVLRDTNLEHYEIIKLFKGKKRNELEAYMRNVHWSLDKATFDSM